MASKHTTVYYASSTADILMMQKNISGIALAAGSTELIRRQTTRSPALPTYVLSIRKVPDLCNIAKTERFIEFGACVTLAEILQLGKKNVPEVLYEAIAQAANPGVRSIATIGGNIAINSQRLSAFAPLIALDAKLEIRSGTEISWMSLIRFSATGGWNDPEKPLFISKIRIPTDSWDIALYRRLGRSGVLSDDTAAFVFLVKSQKNVLSDIRFACTSREFFRNREFENLLIGRSLPMSTKEIRYILDKAESFLDPELFSSTFKRVQILNLLEDGLLNLT